MDILKKIDRTLNIDEGKSKWSFIKDKDYSNLARMSGKTWPQIAYFPNKGLVSGRDDNSSTVSKSLTTKDCTIEGIKRDILPGISSPHPTDDDLKKLLGK